MPIQTLFYILLLETVCIFYTFHFYAYRRYLKKQTNQQKPYMFISRSKAECTIAQDFLVMNRKY